MKTLTVVQTERFTFEVRDDFDIEEAEEFFCVNDGDENNYEVLDRTFSLDSEPSAP